jgi:hypothetical protein
METTLHRQHEPRENPLSDHLDLILTTLNKQLFRGDRNPNRGHAVILDGWE